MDREHAEIKWAVANEKRKRVARRQNAELSDSRPKQPTT
jgi:hypothetical protein